jgi:hypothetical protein
VSSLVRVSPFCLVLPFVVSSPLIVASCLLPSRIGTSHDATPHPTFPSVGAQDGTAASLRVLSEGPIIPRALWRAHIPTSPPLVVLFSFSFCSSSSNATSLGDNGVCGVDSETAAALHVQRTIETAAGPPPYLPYSFLEPPSARVSQSVAGSAQQPLVETATSAPPPNEEPLAEQASSSTHGFFWQPKLFQWQERGTVAFRESKGSKVLVAAPLPDPHPTIVTMPQEEAADWDVHFEEKRKQPLDFDYPGLPLPIPIDSCEHPSNKVSEANFPLPQPLFGPIEQQQPTPTCTWEVDAKVEMPTSQQAQAQREVASM